MREIVDKLKYHELFIRAYFNQGEKVKARPHVDTLLMYIPDNDQYLEYFIEIQEAEGKNRAEVLKEMYQKNKMSLILKKLIKSLDVSTDEEFFTKLLKGDIIKAARKVLPSWSQGIKDIYSDEKKTSILENLLLSNLSSLEKNNKFEGESNEENPHSEMYLLYLLAHHYLKTGNPSKALEYCSKAEEYCPTFIEIYTLKSKIYKKLLDYESASQTLKDIRSIDKADRFLCNITAKYQLLNNEIHDGDATFKQFIYMSDNTEKSIHTLQMMFYEIWLGKAYIRQRKWGRGLRQFHFVFQHINEIAEDQLEFYQYMLRKTSLVSLAEVVKLKNDTIKSDYRLVRGVGYLIKYGVRYRRNLPIIDHNVAQMIKANPELDDKKARKQIERQEKQGVISCNKEFGEEVDLEGKKTLTDLPLAQAAQMLSKTHTTDPALQRLAWSSLFDYYFDEKKTLSAVRALIKLSELNLKEPAYLARQALLSHLIKTEQKEDIGSPVLKIIQEGKLKELGIETALQILETQAKTCYLSQVHLLEVKYLIGQAKPAEAVAQMEELVKEKVIPEANKLDRRTVKKISQHLFACGADVQVVQDLRSAAGIKLGRPAEQLTN